MTELTIDPLTLDEKEDEAYRYYINAQENWRNFVQVALEIKASNQWQQKAKTWELYCKEYMPVGASRIRQLKNADETANMIEAVTEVTPNESQLRALKSAVPKEDRHLLPETFSRASAATKTPTRKDYKATYETLKERETTGGYVSVDGESVVTDVTQVAVNEAVIEAAKRQQEHINTNSKKKRVSIDFMPEMIETKSGRLRLALPEHLPARIAREFLRLYYNEIVIEVPTETEAQEQEAVA